MKAIGWHHILSYKNIDDLPADFFKSFGLTSNHYYVIVFIMPWIMVNYRLMKKIGIITLLPKKGQN